MTREELLNFLNSKTKEEIHLWLDFWVMYSFAEQYPHNIIVPEDYLVYLEKNGFCFDKKPSVSGKNPLEKWLKTRTLEVSGKALATYSVESEDDYTPLFHRLFEIGRCSLFEIEKLLQDGFDPNIRDNKGNTTLFLLILQGQFNRTQVCFSIIEKFIKNPKVNIHSMNRNNANALRLVQELGWEEVVALLLDHGAELSEASYHEDYGGEILSSDMNLVSKASIDRMLQTAKLCKREDQEDVVKVVKKPETLPDFPIVLKEIVASYIKEPHIPQFLYFLNGRQQIFSEKEAKAPGFLYTSQQDTRICSIP